MTAWIFLRERSTVLLSGPVEKPTREPLAWPHPHFGFLRMADACLCSEARRLRIGGPVSWQTTTSLVRVVVGVPIAGAHQVVRAVRTFARALNGALLSKLAALAALFW